MRLSELMKVFGSIFLIVFAVALLGAAWSARSVFIEWFQGAAVDCMRLSGAAATLFAGAVLLVIGGRVWGRTTYAALERMDRERKQVQATLAPGVLAFNRRLEKFALGSVPWIVGWMMLWFVSFASLLQVANDHWAWTALLFAWMFGSLVGLAVVATWSERRLARKLQLICPHCKCIVVRTGRRQRRPWPEPLECQRCGGGLEELAAEWGATDS